ncbi:hypothetical protein AB1Y20_004934 [Prymnesium parvum]|uniref:Uncharacterized protein n=1 Tax=Prymnesium parvum TaxID=97485 RepID=A0AB34J5V4_PRYPA
MSSEFDAVYSKLSSKKRKFDGVLSCTETASGKLKLELRNEEGRVVETEFVRAGGAEVGATLTLAEHFVELIEQRPLSEAVGPAAPPPDASFPSAHTSTRLSRNESEDRDAMPHPEARPTAHTATRPPSSKCEDGDAVPHPEARPTADTATRPSSNECEDPQVASFACGGMTRRTAAAPPVRSSREVLEMLQRH